MNPVPLTVNQNHEDSLMASQNFELNTHTCEKFKNLAPIENISPLSAKETSNNKDTTMDSKAFTQVVREIEKTEALPMDTHREFTNNPKEQNFMANKSIATDTLKKIENEETSLKALSMNGSSTLPKITYKQFHGLTGEILEWAAPYSNTAADIIHLSTFFGAGVGRYPFVTYRNKPVYPNLASFLVGATCAGKGASLSTISPLFDLNDDLIAKSVYTSLNSGKTLMKHLHERYTSSDSCTNILFIDDEGTTQIKRISDWNGTFAEQQCKTLDGDPQSGYMGKKAYNLPPMHMSSIWHCTPAAVHEHLKPKNVNLMNGLMNRFLWMLLEDMPYNPFFTSDSAGFDRCQKKLEKSLEAGGNRQEVPLSPKAIEMVIEFGRKYFKVEGSGEVFSALTSRFPVNAIKLALIFTLLNQEPDVSEQSMGEAITIMERSAESIKALYPESQPKSKPLSVEQCILKTLRLNQRHVARSNLINGIVSVYRYPYSTVSDTIDNLLAMNVISREFGNAPKGRKPEYFFLPTTSNAASASPVAE